jgi:aminoglycoside 3-N-acetyltransferase
MSEREAVARVERPNTVASLTAAFAALGVRRGETLLLNSSLSSLGWVAGGAQATIESLRAALGPDGTLVAPTFSGDRSEPSRWRDPPVHESWHAILRAEMPAFDPETTPTRDMGAIPEALRRWPGAVRGRHPRLSFAALGPRAAEIVQVDDVTFGFGDRGPLGRLYALDARCLLLGVGWANATALHLAEYRWGGRAEIEEGAAVMREGRRVWETYRDFAFDDSGFPGIGAQFEATGAVARGRIGAADARLFEMRAVVDFAQARFAADVG